MKNIIINKLLEPVGNKIKKRPVDSPLKVALDTIETIK